MRHHARRPRAKKRGGLGAKETEEQGPAGFRAPSRRRPRTKKRVGFGAKNGDIRAGGISCTKSAPATGEETRGTWCKGNGDIRAGGISCTKTAPATGEETRWTWCKGNGDIRAGGISCTKSRPAPRPRHARTTPGAPPRPPDRTTLAHTEVYKLPHDNKSVLKGNFFCGIILSPERNQRCNTGNNMKGDAI